MKSAISFITLGVNDLETAKAFYIDKFGWTPIKDSEGIVFFKLNGIILSLFPQAELADDASVVMHREGGFKGFTLAICLNSEEEVNATFEDLIKKGVTIVVPPQKVFWGGYRGYVEDLEKNIWEIAYNPFLELDSEGNVISHQ